MPYVKKERYEKLLALELKDKMEQDRLRERFRLKSRCSSCGHQSMDIYPNENRPCPLLDCEGSMEELK